MDTMPLVLEGLEELAHVGVKTLRLRCARPANVFFEILAPLFPACGAVGVVLELPYAFALQAFDVAPGIAGVFLGRRSLEAGVYIDPL